MVKDMSMQVTGLVINERHIAPLDATLENLLSQSQARCVLLINRDDGSLITSKGFVQSLDTTSLAALAAAAFASSREIARLIGETEFSVLFHQGEREHIHVTIAGPHALLMTLYDDLTTIGLVRICAREAGNRIDQVFSH
jgi:predicted regulator of Ras-like GTPase activity (Roadblock/LC7/MglB family)